MTFSIAPTTTNTSFHAVAADNAQINAKPTEKHVERDVMDGNSAFIKQLEQMINAMTTEQDRRIATVDDLRNVVSALKNIDQEGAETIASSVFNKMIALDPRSPASDAGAGNQPIAEKSLWDVLLAYNLCGPNDPRPTNPAQLKNLIDKVENKNVSISSLSQDKAIVLNRLITSRGQEFDLNANLLRQWMELLQSIVKQM